MTEKEFFDLTEVAFDRVQNALDDSILDIDYERIDGVLTLTLAEGEKIVINRHLPNRELWLAARQGAHHFAWLQGSWRNTRENAEFFATLAGLITTNLGQPFHFFHDV